MESDNKCPCNPSIAIPHDMLNNAVEVTIDGTVINVPAGITVIQACELAGVQIPRFCYHDRLKIAGNCRMCLVDIKPGPPKPQASCAMNVAKGMIIDTKTEQVKKAREGVMEFLLANHPLDCPVCDQGGECDLQDQAFVYGKGISKYNEEKRIVKDKNLGPLIKTNMTRCIHCTRCIRFMEDVAGTSELGAFNRGDHVEISTFLESNITSEVSGNIIDLCPVGALNSKPYTFRARAWELKQTQSIDIMDAVGSNIRIDSKGNEIIRILPSLNENINEEWISDKTRFACDGLMVQRLDSAYIRKNGKLEKATITQAMKAINDKFSTLADPSNEICGIAGDLVDCESIYALRELLSSVSSNNMQCIQDGAGINTASRANYICNTGISNIENCDVILIVGSNPRIEAPIFNLRLRKAFLNGAKIFLLGEKCNLNYKYNHIGDDKSILYQIHNGTHEINKILTEAKMPCFILGQDAISDNDGVDIHNLCLSIAQKYFIKNNGEFNGFNMLHKTAGRVGGLDLDFVSQKNIKQILEECLSGSIKMAIVLGTDEIDQSKLANTFTIYIGTHGDNGVKYADVILPSCTYTEKTATFVNTEGLVQRTTKAVANLGESLEDSEIVKLIASSCGIATKIDNFNTVMIAKHQQKTLASSPYSNSISGNFTIKTKNHYMTCPISRSSKTMALCAKEILQHQ